MVLFGWRNDFTILKSFNAGYTTMKANTALCVLGTSIALMLLSLQSAEAVFRRLVLLCLAIPGIISVLTLSEFIFEVSLGVDQFFIRDKTPPSEHAPFPGRMSQLTALSFLVFTLSILGMNRKDRWGRVSQVLFHCITLVAAIALMGYALRVPRFYSLAFFYSMALPTSICLLLLSVAAAALLPEYGYARLFLSSGIGNVVARRFFPFMFFSVLGLSLLWLEMYRLQAVNIEMGVGITALFFLLATLVLIDSTTGKLNMIDKQRSEAEQRLRNWNTNLEEIVADRTRELTESNRRNQIFVNGAPSAIAMFDTEMRYIAASERWVKDYKLEGRSLIGVSHYDVFPEIGEDWKQIHRDCLAGEINRSSSSHFLRMDGTEMWLMWDVRPWFISENKIGGLLMYTADITELKLKEQEIQSLLNVTRDQNERLRNFAHIVSHNLRSHAGNISMLLDIMTQEHPGVSDWEVVKLLYQSSENLKETIGHLNEVVTISSSVQTNLRGVNIRQHVYQAMQSVSALARERNVTIYNEVDAEMVVAGFEAYIESIILNMLTNAIKYSDTTKESFVRVYGSKEQAYCKICFEDNGIGMNLQVVGERLFGMYKTFHDHPDARGVGLFITKNQVEAMGGKIGVDSEVGVGTTFKVYLKCNKI
ncbi:hypothetical protein GCM10023092_25740 [Rurimicrobium arvi]|uniref:histidine kinase n=1 Tax=Rurimicrobium arvi TaxID=2049916 RepID=A0ABP8N1E2_9BACT